MDYQAIKRAKSVSIIIGSVLASIALFTNVRPYAYAAADLERASDHRDELKQLKTTIEAKDAARDNQIEQLQDQDAETKQWIGCLLWKVPANQCSEYKIPAARTRR